MVALASQLNMGVNMVTQILTAGQSSCNDISSKSFAKGSSKYSTDINTRAIQADKNTALASDKSTSTNRHTNKTYISFHSAQKIIHRFLSEDSIILLPHIVPKLTKPELAKKLNISIAELKRLRKSPKFYQHIAKHICLPLASLCCNTVLQRPKSVCGEGLHHE